MSENQGEGGMAADVATVVARARDAQRGWAALSFSDRGRAFRALSVKVREDAELSRIISFETGKPLFESVGFEIAYLCELTRFLTGSAGRRVLDETRRGSLFLPHKRARLLLSSDPGTSRCSTTSATPWRHYWRATACCSSRRLTRR
jgi:acyl-CoA reductase-like NAD-dependent aldehyde dehydrogenase